MPEGGYHGNTNTTLEMSNYKYMGKGGMGESKHIHSIPIPDGFRGKYRGEKKAKLEAEEAAKIAEEKKAKLEAEEAETRKLIEEIKSRQDKS